MKVDNEMVKSLFHYFTYGLHPGSFGEALLLQDYDLARTRAHFILLQDDRNKQDVVLNMVKFVSHFPSPCIGTRTNIRDWVSFGGFEGASNEYKVLCRLEWDDQFLGRFRAK